MTENNIVTKKEELESEDEEQAANNEVNKVVCKALFLNASKSSKSGSIGITILLYDGFDEKGQVRVSLEQKKSGNVNYTISPVIQAWFSTDPKKTDPAVYKQAETFLNYGGLSDIYPIISGSGDFRRIHRFLSKQQYDMYLDLVK